MIKFEDFPTFWTFMYWLDPLHYALEGLVTTQFNRDHTVVTITGSPLTTTASQYVESFYSEMRYSHRGLDVLALLLFMVALRYVPVLSLYLPSSYLCHSLLRFLFFFSFLPYYSIFLFRIITYFALKYIHHEKR
jgi:ABC-type multidrug transport system permease subunit